MYTWYIYGCTLGSIFVVNVWIACTGSRWRRLIGSLIFIGHFPQKWHIFSGSFVENDLELRGFYESPPPCTLQCNTLTGILKTNGWVGREYWEEKDFIPLFWTIKASHVLISLNQTKMDLWYVYACVCGCDLPWAWNQELGTNHYSVRESFTFATFSSYIFGHV